MYFQHFWSYKLTSSEVVSLCTLQTILYTCRSRWCEHLPKVLTAFTYPYVFIYCHSVRLLLMSAVYYDSSVLMWSIVELITGPPTGLRNTENFNQKDVVEHLIFKIFGFRHAGLWQYCNDISSSSHRRSVAIFSMEQSLWNFATSQGTSSMYLISLTKTVEVSKHHTPVHNLHSSSSADEFFYR